MLRFQMPSKCVGVCVVTNPDIDISISIDSFQAHKLDSVSTEKLILYRLQTYRSIHPFCMQRIENSIRAIAHRSTHSNSIFFIKWVHNKHFCIDATCGVFRIIILKKHPEKHLSCLCGFELMHTLINNNFHS